MLIPVRQCGVDMSVPFLERDFDSIADFVGLALPSAEANGWNLVASVEGEGFPVVNRN